MLAANPALAQRIGGSTGGGSTGGITGSSSSGGFSGGSSGTFSGSGSMLGGSSGTFSGGGSASGGFLGSTSGGAGGGRGGGGSTQAGSTSPFSPYLGNPLYNGQVSSSSSPAQSYQRSFPTKLSFGQPTITANVTTQSQANQSLSQQGLNQFKGASSMNVRRIPSFVTEPVFQMRAQPTMTTLRSELQTAVSNSSRLPSRANISVTTSGEQVILRGQVRDERERRLAEAIVRLTPGVRNVVNELVPANVPGR
jgi:osmotically-inducible protein OsmY